MKPSLISCIVSLLFLALIASAAPAGEGRVMEDFDAGWLFSLGDFQSAMMPGFDDSGWRELDVPHDWSIEGPFGPEYGSGNGFVPGGVGWYRKHFQLDLAQKGRLVAVEIDGGYDWAGGWGNRPL